jgi:EB1-like C-terminal motif
MYNLPLVCADSQELLRARAEIAELKQAAEVLEKERDFYFEKLRDVEVLLQLKEEQGAAIEGIADIFKVCVYCLHSCIASTLV